MRSDEIYQLIKSKVGLKEEQEFQKLYNPKDLYNEALEYWARRNLKRLIALIYYLIVEKNVKFDILIGAGDSGISLVKIAEMVYQYIELESPLILNLPIIRWEPKWLNYHGQDTKLFDNSIFIPQIKDKVDSLNKIENILIIDDEITNGTAVKSAVTILLDAADKDKISPNLKLTIVAEDQGFKTDNYWDRVITEFYTFDVNETEVNNVLSYIVPWRMEEKIKEQFSDKEVSSKVRLNSLLGLPSKEFERFEEYIIEKPVFTNSLENKIKNKIPDFTNMQTEFQKLTMQWIKEAIEEYKA